MFRTKPSNLFKGSNATKVSVFCILSATWVAYLYFSLFMPWSFLPPFLVYAYSSLNTTYFARNIMCAMEQEAHGLGIKASRLKTSLNALKSFAYTDEDRQVTLLQ